MSRRPRRLSLSCFQEEVPVSHSCFQEGLLIAENAV
jgi:hypothetical protein